MYTPEKVLARPFPCMTIFWIRIASISRSREPVLTKPIRPVEVAPVAVLLRMSLPAPSRLKYLTLPVNRKMNRSPAATLGDLAK
jgi:hypothetical protein